MIENVLAAALAAETLGFLFYLRKRDQQDRDERSELTTRLQHPQLLNPRAAIEPPRGNHQPPEPDPRDLAGTVTFGSEDG